MPSKSRKKIKGQARKAKAKAAAAATNVSVQRTLNSNNICPHGFTYDIADVQFSQVCGHFIDTFFKCFFSPNQSSIMDAVVAGLTDAYSKFPDAVNDDTNRQFVKKNFIYNGTSAIIKGAIDSRNMSLGCATALMLIDSYNPSSPVSAGTFDERDAKDYVRNGDILNGCQRSLVKFFMKQIPCNCLDELYSKLRSTTPKMAACPGCRQRKVRKSMYICTGCERITYCSKACQLEHVSIHKEHCKRLQACYIK
jgi:hypothetical protein